MTSYVPSRPILRWHGGKARAHADGARGSTEALWLNFEQEGLL